MNREEIVVGASSCLLGENVRYDGQHKHDRYLTETLGRFFSFLPVCPEVECGLPVPREAMRLVGDADAPRLVGQKSGEDHTRRMLAWCDKKIEKLRRAGLRGFIFKAKSPSSGLHRVKLYDSRGNVCGSTRGLWAAAFTRAFPCLPVEEEGRLHDPDLRENFVERVYTLYRYHEEVERSPSISELMRFHARNKYLLMAHSPSALREMGRLVARAKHEQLAETVGQYRARLMRAMAEPATIPRHVNVLQHLRGYLRGELDHEDGLELNECIEHYREGAIPLIVPITLMSHYVRKYKIDYLAGQYYLLPHPLELRLRNHA